jgi:hypothetical protein
MVKDYDGDERRNSTFRVELWQVILLFVAVIAFLVSSIIGHESRITKVETSTAYIITALDDLKTTAKENNNLIRQHMEKDRR